MRRCRGRAGRGWSLGPRASDGPARARACAMPRLARAVVPDFPHHVTQRGNRRQQTFFCNDDYLLYMALIAEWCHRYRVEVWAYCLMPNHVHLIAVPTTPGGLRRAIGEAHRRYTLEVNHRE